MSEEEKLLKEAKKLPLEDRLLHKNWKVRHEANIHLASLCDSIINPKDSRIYQFGPYFKKTVADSCPLVLEKALDALIAYLRAADADAGRFGKEVCDVVAAKCLMERPETVKKAHTVFMLWLELEAVDAFLDAMEKVIKNKVAKAVVPAIDVMFQALSDFGAKIVPPKRILKMLPELFDYQDKNVRASSKGLTLELCCWIGKDCLKSILFEKMRHTMKKELEAELVYVTGTAKPTRKIRSEQEKVVGPGPSEESRNNAPLEIDEYELVDPIDILTCLENSGFWDGVKATELSKRKMAVAKLTKLASAKRISPGDFFEVCQMLKKLIADESIPVAVEAVQAIGNLAHGLRTHFSANSRFLLPVLLENLKAKKPALTEALTQTLQAMHKAGCICLVDKVIDVTQMLSNLGDVDGAVRRQAEVAIKECNEQKNFPSFLFSLVQELENGNNPAHIRKLAGVVFKNTLLDDMSWLSLDPALKELIKGSLLRTAYSGSDDVQSIASLAIAQVAAIELPSKGWPNLIDSLCLNHPVPALTRQATLKILEYIFEEVSPVSLDQDLAFEIFRAVAQRVHSREENRNVTLAAIRASCNAFGFAMVCSIKIDEALHLMGDVLLLTLSSDSDIKEAASQCLINIGLTQYENLVPHIKCICLWAVNFVEENSFAAAPAVIDFFNLICDEEIIILDEHDSDIDERSSVKEAVSYIVPTLMKTQIIEEEVRLFYMDRIGRAGTCLKLISRISGGLVVPLVLPFIEVNINNPSDMKKKSAIFVLGCVVEGLLSSEIQLMLNTTATYLLMALTDGEPDLRIISAWSVWKIFKKLAPSLVEI